MVTNLPEYIYKLSGLVIVPAVYWLVPFELISQRLIVEQSYLNKDWQEYTTQTLTVIHERASTMVGHLSLMLGVCLFVLQSGDFEKSSVEGIIIAVDVTIYIVLVILSVRALRSFGFDRDRDIEEYKLHLHSELALRYSIMQLVNSLTIVATVILVVALLMHVWI